MSITKSLFFQNICVSAIAQSTLRTNNCKFLYFVIFVFLLFEALAAKATVFMDWAGMAFIYLVFIKLRVIFSVVEN